jgi:hypothetical protein
MGNRPGGDAGGAFGKTYWTLSHNIYSTDTIPDYFDDQPNDTLILTSEF